MKLVAETAYTTNLLALSYSTFALIIVRQYPNGQDISSARNGRDNGKRKWLHRANE